MIPHRHWRNPEGGRPGLLRAENNKSVSTTFNTMIKAGGSDLSDHYKSAPSVRSKKHAQVDLFDFVEFWRVAAQAGELLSNSNKRESNF